MNKRIPILVYHHVYPDDHPGLALPSEGKVTGVVARSEFQRHMSYLVDNEWEVVSTTQVVERLESGAKLPDRSVVLHFDNGWLDTREIAMPILLEYGMTGTCYVISEATEAASEGRPATIRTSTEGSVAKPFITWRHAEEMLEAGWEIGAHTATHPKLADVYESDGDGGVLAEVEGPNETYARRLGSVPSHFAYPSGSRSDRTDAILSRYYRSLRLWRFSFPPRWSFTDSSTSPLGLECQNIDNTVPFEDFTRIFSEALDA